MRTLEDELIRMFRESRDALYGNFATKEDYERMLAARLELELRGYTVTGDGQVFRPEEADYGTNA